jgi:hypothetical protein
MSHTHIHAHTYTRALSGQEEELAEPEDVIDLADVRFGTKLEEVLLLAVCCLLSVVCCLLSVVCCLLSVG